MTKWFPTYYFFYNLPVMSVRITERMQTRMDKIRSMRRPEAQPYFHFPELLPSERLSYRPLGYDNYLTLSELFIDDSSPYTNPEFKQLERIELYVVSLLEFAQYSPKRCGKDWIVHQIGSDLPVGVVHIYDLTKETQRDSHRNCTIGFAIAAPYRRQGFAKEAVGHLTSYIFQHFDLTHILAYTIKENQPSQQLLNNLGFRRNDQDYTHPDHYAFFEMERPFIGG